MRFCVSLLSVTLLLLAACGQRNPVDYGFSINNVSISRAYQSLNVNLQQSLALSEQARSALNHGVTLTVILEMELRNDNNMTVVRRDVTRFQFRYLPLSERYQLADEKKAEFTTYSRLRHLLASIDNLQVQLPTGPLPSGSYKLRTRLRLDESRLPAPMQLPAWFSAQWNHDSDWSVWPFKINA